MQVTNKMMNITMINTSTKQATADLCSVNHYRQSSNHRFRKGHTTNSNTSEMVPKTACPSTGVPLTERSSVRFPLTACPSAGVPLTDCQPAGVTLTACPTARVPENHLLIMKGS
jgi:hypothetical protein